jgi:hypothetical protein
MAVDQCQPQIERALQKDGWRIVSSPKHFIAEENDYFIDLELTRQIRSEQGLETTIYIEVKCLQSGSLRTDLYIALGQYGLYQQVLIHNKVDAPLYLAVPETAYTELFDTVVRQAFARIGAKIVIINLETEVVKSWITF